MLPADEDFLRAEIEQLREKFIVLKLEVERLGRHIEAIEARERRRAEERSRGVR